MLKQGTHLVGVARQYSGTAGRIEPCQIGVFLTYASRFGQALIDRRFYLPEAWASGAARRAKASVPTAIAFATKPTLAQYVGIDNRASGRLAAQLLGRLVGPRSGTVLLFLGSRSYRGEIGFRNVLEDDFPSLSIVPVRDVRDDNDVTHREGVRLLRAHHDLVGIYNIAGGNRGLARAVQEAGVADRITFVAQELTGRSRPLLVAGLIDVLIDQDPAREPRDLLQLLVHGTRRETPTAPIRITPFFRENLP